MPRLAHMVARRQAISPCSDHLQPRDYLSQCQASAIAKPTSVDAGRCLAVKPEFGGHSLLRDPNKPTRVVHDISDESLKRARAIIFDG